MTSGHDTAFDSRATRFRFGRGSAADYRTLGVSETASDAEIEQAYLRLIDEHQPDRLVGLALEFRRRAEKKLRGIDAAYGRIRAQRRRDAQSSSTSEASRAAMATADDRLNTGGLLWVAMALIALVMVAWLAGMREPRTIASQPPVPAAGESARTSSAPPSSLPASVRPPPSASASDVPAMRPIATLPVATNDAGSASVDRLVTLMPKDAPPAPQAPPALSGEAALVEALRAGQLRPATGGDFSRWAQRWSQANRRGAPTGMQERAGFMKSYVIQREFTIPDGLNGAHAVIFLLDTGAPYPRGDSGHSVVLDLSTGACMGVTCGMLLD
ncbi:hypothetical protein [Lysobacter hankyongensis]|uniref:J domain-containing protein n=1 Tax=Lysobacter hankyongensis TaxID=1176535 RepID=A0ABP9BMK0_9GAMM